MIPLDPCDSPPLIAHTSHIPSHTFVARNLRKDAFSPKNVDENLRTWRNGGAQSITFLGEFVTT